MIDGVGQTNSGGLMKIDSLVQKFFTIFNI